ncbi:MAG TPA: serpin family protein, partial [Longimicrobiales bacterium]
LLRQLRARASRIEFVVANSIWYHQTFPVYPTFTDTVRHYFDAEVRALDFGNAASPGIISDWAAERTAGRIKDLVESIDPNEIMFLVNAVYFKAPWHMRFAQSETRAQPFTLPNGGSVNAQMMFVDGTFSYVENQGVQAVELLYGDTTFSIVLVMPRTGSSLDAATSILEPTQWGALISSMHRSRINLRIPKFRFEYEKKLTQPLSDLGMAIAFQPFQADFTKIANRDDIYISRVQHKAFIEVNEAGTEAAAATSVGISVTSAPPELVFNRPFFFAIRERSTGTLLFVGRIADPTQTE